MSEITEAAKRAAEFADKIAGDWDLGPGWSDADTASLAKEIDAFYSTLLRDADAVKRLAESGYGSEIRTIHQFSDVTRVPVENGMEELHFGPRKPSLWRVMVFDGEPAVHDGVGEVVGWAEATHTSEKFHEAVNAAIDELDAALAAQPAREGGEA